MPAEVSGSYGRVRKRTRHLCISRARWLCYQGNVASNNPRASIWRRGRRSGHAWRWRPRGRAMGRGRVRGSSIPAQVVGGYWAPQRLTCGCVLQSGSWQRGPGLPAYVNHDTRAWRGRHRDHSPAWRHLSARRQWADHTLAAARTYQFPLLNTSLSPPPPPTPSLHHHPVSRKLSATERERERERERAGERKQMSYRLVCLGRGDAHCVTRVVCFAGDSDVGTISVNWHKQ